MALRTGLAEHMSRAGSESLLTGRAAIDANDQSEPSSRGDAISTTIAAR